MSRSSRLITLVIALCVHASLKASPSTEIVIVGTVHKETTAYKAKDLVDILKRVHPDVILVEKDTSFFTKGFECRRFWDGLEDTALRAFLEEVKVPLRPYDIEGRNNFYEVHDIFAREKAMDAAIDSARDKGWLELKDLMLLDEAHAAFKRRNVFLNSDPMHINSFECDQAIADKIYVVSIAYCGILRSTVKLQVHWEFWRTNEAFEARRNQSMVNNIEKWAWEFQGKRILVLCGFEHRHFLRQRLLVSEVPGLSVKEYWELADPGRER